MPLAKNREFITITTPAQKHLKAIVRALKARGLSTNMTAYASELILSQPIPTDKHPKQAVTAKASAEEK